MREVLLHGGSDEAFDRSVTFARRLAESFGARLHVLYTVKEPLSAGWTSEMGTERMPELHQAMETEARERLARFISIEDQERLGVVALHEEQWHRTPSAARRPAAPRRSTL